MSYVFRHAAIFAATLLLVVVAKGDLVNMSLASTSSGNLTAQGGVDWVMFGASDFVAGSPRAGTSPDDRKSGVGSPSPIGNVTPTNSNPTYDFANFSAAPDFTWTDGSVSSVSTGTPAMMVIRPSGVGDGFSFSVAAPVGVTQTLTVYTQAFRGTATMTATLDNATDVESYAAVNGASDVSGVFTVVYQAMTAGQTLDINFLSSGVSGISPSIGVGAIALSAVPEPSSFLFLGLVFALGIGAQRCRRTTHID